MSASLARAVAALRPSIANANAAPTRPILALCFIWFRPSLIRK
jgi:hypothetical protein